MTREQNGSSLGQGRVAQEVDQAQERGGIGKLVQILSPSPGLTGIVWVQIMGTDSSSPIGLVGA